MKKFPKMNDIVHKVKIVHRLTSEKKFATITSKIFLQSKATEEKGGESYGIYEKVFGRFWH